MINNKTTYRRIRKAVVSIVRENGVQYKNVQALIHPIYVRLKFYNASNFHAKSLFRSIKSKVPEVWSMQIWQDKKAFSVEFRA